MEWIGEIPSHWETKRLKYISEITYGISPPDTTYNDEGIGTILINGPVEYSETDFGLTRSLKWTTEPKKFTSKGSLLFCLRGSTTGRMNITHTDVSIGRGVCSINSSENQWFLIYSMFSVLHSPFNVLYSLCFICCSHTSHVLLTHLFFLIVHSSILVR